MLAWAPSPWPGIAAHYKEDPTPVDTPMIQAATLATCAAPALDTQSFARLETIAPDILQYMLFQL